MTTEQDILQIALECGAIPCPEMGDTDSRWIMSGTALEAFADRIRSTGPQAVDRGEVVAWRYMPSKVWGSFVLTDDPEKAKLASDHGCDVQPLYAHPTTKLPQAVEAETAVIVARYKAGNTALLEALMDMVLQYCCAPEINEDLIRHGYISSNEAAVAVLEEAGMVTDGRLNWPALEARKPKRKSWAEAVNECVTDPAERARLLAMEFEPAHPTTKEGSKP